MSAKWAGEEKIVTTTQSSSLPDDFMLSPEQDGTATVIFRAANRRICALPNVPAPEGLSALHEDVARHFYIYYAHARTLHEELTKLGQIVRAILRPEGVDTHDERKSPGALVQGADRNEL